MDFDRWFYQQSRAVQVLLLIIPVIGWCCECLVRLGVLLRTRSPLHLIVFLLFLFIGWGWILCLLDILYLLVTGRLFLA